MQKETRARLFTALLFPVALIYFEVLFRVFTTRSPLQIGNVYMVLLSIAYGCIGYLLSTISKNKKRNHIIAVCLLALTAIPYLVEYFVFRQFNIYYDLNTIFGGAGHVIEGFLGETLAMIFCFDGLSKITLFFLPALLLLIFGRRFMPIRRIHVRTRIVSLLLVFFLLIGSRLGILLNKPLNLLMDSQYNFQSAISQFGLITGIGLDIRHSLVGSTSSFEIVTMPTEDTTPVITTEPTEATEATEAMDITEPTTATEETVEATTAPTKPPVVRVPQVMDINLDDPDASSRIAELNAYVASQRPTKTNEYTGMFKGKNLIFITAEAFCAEAISPDLTPTLYRLATKGIQFTDFYQPSGAGTTGGEYQNVFGMLPVNGGASFKNTADNLNYFTMGNQLNRLGYWGRAYHNNSHTYYDRHKTHINLGYSEGFLAYGNGMEEYITLQWPESDLEMFVGSIPDYINNQPFNVYYMTVSGHSAYFAGGNAIVQKHWERVEDLPYSKPVRGYLAAQLDLEDALTYLLEQLDAAGITDDTVICLASDHFPYGLDDDAALGALPYLSELYGYNVTNSMDRDHSALIIWSGCLEDMDPIVVDTPTFSLDILPTLSNLFGVEYDSRLLPGRDVFSDARPLVYNMYFDWKTEYGSFNTFTNRFTPVSEDVIIADNYVETMSAIVRNKYRYCDLALNQDYFRYLFETEEES